MRRVYSTDHDDIFDTANITNFDVVDGNIVSADGRA
jgi:hypothetical protein